MMEKLSKNVNLIGGFLNSLRQCPNRLALEVDDISYTYQQLAAVSAKIGKSIKSNKKSSKPLVAFLCYRSLAAYASVLGILSAGKGYVPLNPNFPKKRILAILSIIDSDIVIIGQECNEYLKILLPELDKSFTFIMQDFNESDNLSKKYANQQFIDLTEIDFNLQELIASDVHPDSTAYLLFTSGSTGKPKGVPVSHKNVTSYIDYTCARYDFETDDRFSQSFDMTFDLSVHDMFICWESGACLCCIPEKSVMLPAKFIKDKKLTVWFSVPSVGMFLSKMRMLKPNSFPTLRYSLFCGEPLPESLAQKWQDAAPNSILENLYGPTEATIAITNYQWNNKLSPALCRNGIVPIGWTFDSQKSCIVNNKFKSVAKGEKGELCLGGSQVTNGYLNDPEKTRAQFISIEEMGRMIWYRTGDLVRQDENGCMHYIERLDNQVQILGFRVELQEIDAILRKASGLELAISIAWPIKDSRAEGVVGFICGDKEMNSRLIINYCKKYLPPYMVPSKIYFIDKMPLNANGKINRAELIKGLEENKI